VREDGRIVGGEGWQKKVHNRRMEEAPENGKELSHSAHAKGINEGRNISVLQRIDNLKSKIQNLYISVLKTLNL
jgi:hypothetical protein